MVSNNSERKFSNSRFSSPLKLIVLIYIKDTKVKEIKPM